MEGGFFEAGGRDSCVGYAASGVCDGGGCGVCAGAVAAKASEELRFVAVVALRGMRGSSLRSE